MKTKVSPGLFDYLFVIYLCTNASCVIFTFKIVSVFARFKTNVLENLYIKSIYVLLVFRLKVEFYKFLVL